jgi:uncharacterized protein YprB with RNaseH-like and TPR domain
MLENTFIHLQGIGEAKERKFWERGIRCWDEFLECFASEKKNMYECNRIAGSKHALKNNDPEFFADTLANRDTWRAFPHFGKVAYVDIETTGLGKGIDYVTVVGLYDGNNVKSYVHGDNLEEFPDEIKKYEMVVTFNGAMFDLPFLRREFVGIKLPALHSDLRFVLASLGQRGGLKKIEERFGFEREEDIKGLNGFDAVKLWSRYKKKNDLDALDLLVRYNAADISNLKKLMEWGYREKRKETGFDEIHKI